MQAQRFDTVGEDLVNHSVNDILVHGAAPIAFMDYIAGAALGVEQIAQIVEGIARGCRSHGMALAGGETAQMPGLYQPGTYDLAGTIIGVVEEDRALHGDAIVAGDVLLGYASTGLHTNGYSLARKLLFDVAGYGPKWASTVIMRIADVIMSFPSLLLAVIVLYMLKPSVANLILVLAITRIPIYLRTTRAEALEIRERMFVQAAQVMGASSRRIVFRHILPMVIPTLVTIATLDFAFVMLAESALSFLGIGIQPPEITWGLMVAQGRQYLANAWWLAFWPGLAIILTTLSLNLLSGWLRIALDPAQRWRLEIGGRKNG